MKVNSKSNLLINTVIIASLSNIYIQFNWNIDMFIVSITEFLLTKTSSQDLEMLLRLSDAQ
jgi:hypothetical protein